MPILLAPSNGINLLSILAIIINNLFGAFLKYFTCLSFAGGCNLQNAEYRLQDRIFPVCKKEMEDEIHFLFLLRCPRYESIRQNFYQLKYKIIREGKPH